jgi:exo-beta-1,3-glucanase (GH17 family)/cellulose synthase/poly-beta-1,6-N-acetylglucosamine synthase-like glycosyltransferase
MKPVPEHQGARWPIALAVVVFAAAVNLGLWQLLHGKVPAPEVTGTVAGFAYNASGRWQRPEDSAPTSADVFAQDMAVLAHHTRRIRTYSAADHAELPRIAAQHGLEVMLGAWLDDRLDSNQRELAAAVNLARTHKNIRRLIVGNETQLKAKLPPNRLAAYLDQARAALRTTDVKVSTAEPWHVWIERPQLARHVDFIAIHVLPYWAGESISDAVRTTLAQIEQVKMQFPGREVVVAEVGWPSNGAPWGKARATAANQAVFVRNFLQQANAAGLDYFLIEAFDQPWKIYNEGRVGAYWGVWDTSLQPKFGFTGPVLTDPRWQRLAVTASLLGGLLALPFLLAVPRLRLAGRLTLAAAAQATASLGVLLLSIPLAHYLRATDVLGLVLVIAALAFITATLLTQAFEFVERFWAKPTQPAHAPPAASQAPPFVSIHMACANEPPEMVMHAVESLLALDWPAFEVIVVDNNTSDARARHRLARWMAERGDPRLRFAQFEQLAGFKAGALNQALALTSPQAQWIAVVDADYEVASQWLREVQPHLQDPSVSVVQAPQAHRHWAGGAFDRMMNWETEGFFRIGMHHRHERNAIIQHGTMTLVRAERLQRLRWNEDCVCEDTELGLRLLSEGGRAVYADRVLGTGLLPLDFVAYARQRRRWALGGMQIFKAHARSLLGGTGGSGHSEGSGLTAAQRYHFLAGWLPWLGDALHLLFSVVMILFSLGMVYRPNSVEPPLWLFVAPLIAFFVARLLIGPLLYMRCVPCGWADRLGAAVAGMALSHSVARGVLQGLFRQRAVFDVTRKSAQGPSAASGDAPYRGPPLARGIEQEVGLLAGLLFCIALLAFTRSDSDAGRLGWMSVLFIQSLPYVAAVVCRLVETFSRLKPAPVRSSSSPSSTPTSSSTA